MTAEKKSNRKPHMHNAGYVTERKSQHPKLPGHIVIYDRDAEPSPGIDADERWIVMHEPSSYHVSVKSRQVAQDLMVSMAAGGNDIDLGQHEEPLVEEDDQDCGLL